MSYITPIQQHIDSMKKRVQELSISQTTRGAELMFQIQEAEILRDTVEKEFLENYNALLEGCRKLLDAPHYDHFAARLNWQEMEGLNAIQEALTKFK